MGCRLPALLMSCGASLMNSRTHELTNSRTHSYTKWVAGHAVLRCGNGPCYLFNPQGVCVCVDNVCCAGVHNM